MARLLSKIRPVYPSPAFEYSFSHKVCQMELGGSNFNVGTDQNGAFKIPGVDRAVTFLRPAVVAERI